jgi:hypothetical protein
LDLTPLNSPGLIREQLVNGMLDQNQETIHVNLTLQLESGRVKKINFDFDISTDDAFEIAQELIETLQIKDPKGTQANQIGNEI